MRQRAWLAMSAAAAVAGVLLYALFRPEGLQAALWLGEFWPASRTGNWVGAGWLPGGLWMFSATALQAAIWADHPGRARSMWLLAPLTLGIGWEAAQAAGVLAGIYDRLDLAAYAAGWALACLLPRHKETVG